MAGMPKRSGKTPSKIAKLPIERGRDVNKMASAVLRRTLQLAEDEPPKKNPAAVALGRRGGLKGGKARMAALTPEQRRRLAMRAAKARWSKPKGNS